jgi:glycine betaine/proline transport system permease protein
MKLERVTSMYKLNELFTGFTIPANEWIQAAILWAIANLRPIFLAIRWPVSTSLEFLDQSLRDVPAVVTIVVIGLLAWRASGIALAIWSVAGFLLIGFLGLWDMAMTTVAMVLTSVIFCVVIGVPTGILVSRSSRLEMLIRPVLDAMQTTPTFVYLVPIVMLFGIGNVPAVIATIIVALPPTIRLTSLGLREVDQEIVEAGRAFGCTSMQLLREIQIPLALATIMTGINQSLMLALSMVVVAALIGAGGLGLSVYSGINRLDVGVAATAGLSIVLIAIITDRIGQAFVNRYSKN